MKFTGTRCLWFLLLMALVLSNGALCRADEIVTNGNFALDGVDWTLTPAEYGSDFDYGLTGEAEFGAITPPYYDTISQTLVTQTDYSYTLTFNLFNAENTDEGDFQALWNGTSVVEVTGSDPTDQGGYYQYSVDVASSSDSSTLAFEGYEVPSFYYLTDVSVSTNGPLPVVPESPTLLYLLLGAGAGFGAKFLNSRVRPRNCESA